MINVLHDLVNLKVQPLTRANDAPTLHDLANLGVQPLTRADNILSNKTTIGSPLLIQNNERFDYQFQSTNLK
jgi:hypothetical protein